MLMRLKTPIDFQAIDGEPVDLIFFLLALVSQEGAQLNALACVARKLRDEKVLRELRRAPDTHALYKAILI